MVGLVRQLVHVILDHILEVGVVGVARLELAMHDLERLRHCIVLAFQGAETCENRVIDALHENDAVEGIKLLLLQVLVPLLHFGGDLRQALILIHGLLCLLNLSDTESFGGPASFRALCAWCAAS